MRHVTLISPDRLTLIALSFRRSYLQSFGNLSQHKIRIKSLKVKKNKFEAQKNKLMKTSNLFKGK